MIDNKRKLASVQVVKEIQPMENCDNIEIAKVLGWQCVVAKGKLKPGDLCIYFEVDSFLPLQGRYEFLRNSCYKNSEVFGEGFRIKTQRIRGYLSQGLALSLNDFPDLGNELKEGTDLTRLLGIQKWELITSVGDLGDSMGDKPHGIPTTDEIRIQSIPHMIDVLKEKECYMSVKVDGMSVSIYNKDGNVGVTTRECELIKEMGSRIWRYFIKHGIDERIKELGKNIVIQGEFAGDGIWGNKLGLKEDKWYVFDAMDLDTGRYYNLCELIRLCNRLNIDMVEVIYVGAFNYNLDELLEKAKGNYSSGKKREGIVVRSTNIVKEYNDRVSFKVLNNDYLLKNRE